jgi:hypothetical protein
MNYFVNIENEKINGKSQVNNSRFWTDDYFQIEVTEEIYNNIEKYIYQDGKIVLNPNYEEEIALQEKERIAKLFLTGADVERGIYQAKGMDFEDIIECVSRCQNGEALSFGVGTTQARCDAVAQELCQDIDIKALKIELKANNFYRGNPYVSAIGALLGFSDEQLDKFFEDGNYEHLLVF